MALLSSAPLFADDKDAVAKLAKDLKAKDAKVRRAAAQKLGEFGADAARPLCDAILDKEVSVRNAALMSLEKANPKLYKPVSALVLDGTAEKRREAVQELGALGKDARPAIPILISEAVAAHVAAEKSGYYRSVVPEYMKAVADVGGEEKDVVSLFKAAADSPYEMVREPALAWLLVWAAGNEARGKELLPVVKLGLKDDPAGVPFIEAAGSLKGLSKDLLPALKKLKLSSHSEVREAATNAVASIEK